VVRASGKLGLKAYEVVGEEEELKRFIETSLETTDSQFLFAVDTSVYRRGRHRPSCFF